MMLDINCNAVRCWGGSVYEDHEFLIFAIKTEFWYGRILQWGALRTRKTESFLKNARGNGIYC